MLDWIIDWFSSLFNGSSDVIKDGGDKIDGAVHASVPAFFDVIFPYPFCSNFNIIISF